MSRHSPPARSGPSPYTSDLLRVGPCPLGSDSQKWDGVAETPVGVPGERSFGHRIPGFGLGILPTLRGARVGVIKSHGKAAK